MPSFKSKESLNRAFRRAVADGDLARGIKLRLLGADIRESDDRAFWLAVQRGQVAVVRYLMREGIDPRSLHEGLIGCAAVWEAMVDLLVSKGVKVGTIDARWMCQAAGDGKWREARLVAAQLFRPALWRGKSERAFERGVEKLHGVIEESCRRETEGIRRRAKKIVRKAAGDTLLFSKGFER